ncbi:MAG: shikimate kinase [Hyphomicrobiaceae bacterium]
MSENLPNQKHSAADHDEGYLRIVGERVRLQRVRLSMSRKVLSQSSGVSERYLAELERGTGNASLLILRRIARALGLKVSDFVTETVERPIDLTLAITQLERLGPSDVIKAHRLVAERFGPKKEARANGIVALIGLRGAGKATIGKLAAEALGVAFVDLDHEIEQQSGMELSEIFSTRGEQAYRDLELEALKHVIANNDRAILATGGGIVTSDENFNTLLKNCLTVWLRASPEQLLERARKAVALRPTGLSRQASTELTLMLENRQPLYAQADAGLDTQGLSETDLAHKLVQLIAAQSLRSTSKTDDPVKSPKLATSEGVKL